MSSEHETPVKKASIADRFLNAKLEQQKIEEARKSALRVNASVLASPISGRFEQALANQQSTEKSRYIDKKNSTQSDYRVTEGTGLVRRRISEYEALFVQAIVSIDKLNRILKKARAKASRVVHSLTTF